MIRYARLFDLYTSSIWALNPMTLDALGRGLAMAMRGEVMRGKSAEVEDGHWSVPVTMYGRVAVVGLHGVIGKYLSSMELACVGGCDLERVGKTLRTLGVDPAVGVVVLHVNSPGGTITGVPEFSKEVAELDAVKPVYAYTDELMCSAGYWIGCSARGVFASESADVGSIGVYMALMDQTRALSDAGIDVRLVRAGRLKGVGLPGTWTDEVEEYLQARVDSTYEAFTSWVRKNRGQIDDETMQGQVFDVYHAMPAGLIDGILNRVEDLVSQVAKAHNLEV